MTGTMRAIRLHPPGGLDGLALDRVEIPEAEPGMALVRIHAAAITRDELGWPTDRLPAIPSYEFSGVISAVGLGVDTVAVGDAVYGLAGFDRDGAAADHAAFPAAILAAKPRTLDHVRSAAIPLAALSAWQGLFVHGRLEAGQRVLIHGATGGVGHLATQLARWRGAHVIATVSHAGPDAASAAGVDELIDDSQARFEEVLDPVDLVFDTVGGRLLERSPAIVRRGGRVVSVADAPREVPAEAGIEASYFVVEPDRGQLVELTGLVEAGELRPAIDSVFPLEEARAAFERSMARGKRGKVVLRVADG